jgi:nucleoside-diphosphate kinase
MDENENTIQEEKEMEETPEQVVKKKEKKKKTPSSKKKKAAKKKAQEKEDSDQEKPKVEKDTKKEEEPEKPEVKKEPKNEYEFVMIKPDGYARGLIHKVFEEMENRGFKIIRCATGNLERSAVEQLYAEHCGKPWFKDNIDFICSGSVFISVWAAIAGSNLVERTRELVGSVLKAPGTIRGRYATDIRRNVVHASDSIEAAQREMLLFFPDMKNYF